MQLEELRDISEEEYLLEFVKVEQYVHLAAVAIQQANTMEAVYKLMEEISTENLSSRTIDISTSWVHNYLEPRTTSSWEGDFKYGSDDIADEEHDD